MHCIHLLIFVQTTVPKNEIEREIEKEKDQDASPRGRQLQECEGNQAH